MIGLSLAQSVAGNVGAVSGSVGGLVDPILARLSAADLWLDARDIVTGAEATLPNRGTFADTFDVVGPTLVTGADPEIVSDGVNDYVALGAFVPSYTLTGRFVVLWVGSARADIGNWSRFVSFETAGSVGMFLGADNNQKIVATQSNVVASNSLSRVVDGPTVNTGVTFWCAAEINDGTVQGHMSGFSGSAVAFPEDPTGSSSTGRVFSVGYGTGQNAEASTYAAVVWDGANAPADLAEIAAIGDSLVAEFT